MADKIEDGGPAFPAQPLGADGMPMCSMEVGMSLRDWFAGQALAGLLADPNVKMIADDVAYRAFELADAMLRARKPEAAHG